MQLCHTAATQLRNMENNRAVNVVRKAEECYCLKLKVEGVVTTLKRI